MKVKYRGYNGSASRKITLPFSFLPSFKKGCTLKGKNLLPGANFFLRVDPFCTFKERICSTFAPNGANYFLRVAPFWNVLALRKASKKSQNLSPSDVWIFLFWHEISYTFQEYFRYQSISWEIMIDCVQWNLVYSWTDFCLQPESVC